MVNINISKGTPEIKIKAKMISDSALSFIRFDQDYCSFFAIDGDEPVGVIGAKLRKLSAPVDNLTEVYIDIIEVNFPYRRKGIGIRLLNEIYKWAQDINAYQLRAWSDEIRIEAHRLWEKSVFSFAQVDFSSGDEKRYGFYVTKRVFGSNKPEFLYHGSQYLFDVLIPQQAQGNIAENGAEYGIYACDNIDAVIPFALPIRWYPDEPGGRRDFEVDKNGLVVIKEGQLNPKGYGYVYKISSETFRKIDNWQWVSTQSVIPVEVIKISVSDYMERVRFEGNALKLYNNQVLQRIK